jgi:hypothetical protein
MAGCPLTGVKSTVLYLCMTGSLWLFCAGNSLGDEIKLRFAVGTFDGWQPLREALHDERARSLDFDNFSWLALERSFVGDIVLAPSRKPLVIQPLSFPNNPALIACTSGPLANCLLQRLRLGASSLKDALGHWLIPRHAAHFQDAVQEGKIAPWIQLADANDERRACEWLLARSSGSVGVHDFVLPKE